MIHFLRKLSWRFLGISYYRYLKGRNTTWLKDADWVKVGAHTYDNGAFVWRWYKHSGLEIGNYCSIAPNVQFICDPGYHTESEITSFPLFHEIMEKEDLVEIKNTTYAVRNIQEQLSPGKTGIQVGNDVWIGMNAVILPGVKIGNGATILAGAVVSKDVPAYAIAGGVPAVVVRMKHDAKIIEKLNAISWWNWPENKIKDCVNDFYLPVSNFIQKHQ